MLNKLIQPINAKAFACNYLFNKSNILFLLLFSILMFSANAQPAQEDNPAPALNIGDAAPPLRVRQWLKGTPVKKFKKGQVYVVEFWATWCAPCKAAMPHLSALAREYKNKVTFLSVDVMEDKRVTPQRLQRFVDSMGKKMDYNVAAEDSNYMATGWLNATGEMGIPHAFVVNANGQLAWIGHPSELPGVLPKITSGNWDIATALAERNEQRRLTAIDNDVYYDLLNYTKSENWAGSQDKPDSLLMKVAAIVNKEPQLKYAPMISAYTFPALLKTDMRKACEYGKEGLRTKSLFDYEPSFFIMGNIEIFQDSLALTPEIYRLGIEACQAEIAQTVYPEISNDYKKYSLMANWYWRLHELDKAIIAQQKAIASIKAKTHYAAKDLAALELQLKKYKEQDFGGLKSEGLKQ